MARAAGLSVRKEVLANGLTLLVAETRIAPIAALSLTVRTGSADDPPGLGGLAHFLEHMILKGGREGSPGRLARAVQDVGGYMNAATGLDQTTFYEVVPVPHWPDVLEAQVDTLLSARFERADVDSERSVIVEETRMTERDPSSFLWRRVMELGFQSCPHGRPVTGTEDTLSAIDADALTRHMRKRYVPANMVQVVVGDVCGGEVVARARESLLALGAGGRPGSAGERTAPVWSPSHSVVRGMTEQPYVAVAFEAVPALHSDAPALDVLCGLLGAGRSSRLRKRLRTSLGLTSSVGASLTTLADTGLVFVRAVGTVGSSVERIVEEIVLEVRRFGEEGVSGPEMAKSVRRLEAAYALDHETVESVAGTLSFFEALGDYRSAEEYVDRVSNVTPADVVRAANTYLVPELAVVVSVVPGGGEGSSGDSVAAAVRRAAHAPLRPGGVGVPPERAGRGASLARVERPRFERPMAVSEPAAACAWRLRSDCGATVVVREATGLPLVSVALAFAGGFVEEPDHILGLTGVTLKHMLRGTRTRGAERLADDFESLGSGISVSLDRDGFGIGATFLSKHADTALDILGEILTEPALLDEELEAVKAEALSELGQAEDRPFRRTMRRLVPLLFPGHPYGRSLSGTRETVGSVSRGETGRWHRERVVADRLFVCVTGDAGQRFLDRLDSVLSGLERRGGSSALEKVARLRQPDPPAGTVDEPAAMRGQSSVAIGLPGPRIGTSDSVALNVLSSAVTMMDGRLWNAMRERPPHAYTVQAMPVPLRAGGAFVAYVTTPPGQEDAAVEALVREFRAIAREGLTPDEVSRGRRRLAGMMEISMQRGATRAASYALAEVAGLGFEHVERLPELIRRVSDDDVVRVARKFMTAEDGPASVVLRG